MSARHTPAQAAESLFRVMPRAVSPSMLEEYGIEAPREQAQHITRELLSLSLFWARWALRTHMSARNAELVLDEFRQCVLRNWDTSLGQVGQDVQRYFDDMQERHLTYDEIIKEGGTPVAVATEAASIMEQIGAIRTEDRQRALALLIDQIPVDELGEMAENIKLID